MRLSSKPKPLWACVAFTVMLLLLVGITTVMNDGTGSGVLEETPTPTAGYDQPYNATQINNLNLGPVMASTNITPTPVPTATPTITPIPTPVPPTPTPLPTYTVVRGNNLSYIAQSYGVTVCDLVVANNLTTSLIYAGKVLQIPAAGTYPECALEEPVVATRTAASGYMWPVRGTINQYYSGYHLAIDIGAGYGSGVVAIEAGTVRSAGWAGACGYTVVVIGKVKTVYCHLSEMYVSAGAVIGQGQTVGTVGTTGWATGPHLHLEIIVNGYYVNPLSYLP